MVVPDLETGIDLWRQRFGLMPTVVATVEEQGVRACLLECGDGEIELLEPLDSEGPIARYLAKGGGIHHVCFETHDVGGELERAASRAVPCIDHVPRRGIAGRIGFLHPKATFNSLVEFASPGGGIEVEEWPGEGGGNEPWAAVQGWSRLIWAVQDLDRARQVFEENFDLAADPQVVELPEFGADAIEIRLPNIRIQLASSIDDSGWLAQRLADNGEGAALLGLDTSASLAQAAAKFQADGVQAFDREPVGSPTCQILDPAAHFGFPIALESQA